MSSNDDEREPAPLLTVMPHGRAREGAGLPLFRALGVAHACLESTTCRALVRAELGLIKVGLDACLLTDEELAFPPAAGTNAAADAKDVQQGGGEDGEDGEEEEEEESEDSKWSRREEAWAQLPGAQAWASLLDA